ncbi:MAG: PHB depolymerase family esterase [Pseudomonadota bacterium]
MKPILPDAMREATRLTHGGRLGEATALLQRLLGGQAQPGRASAAPPADARGTYSGAAIPLPAPDAAPRPSGAGTSASQPRQAAAPDPSARRWLPKIRAKRAAPTEPLPIGAQFLDATYLGASGRLRFKLYIPANRPDGPAPLLIMLHGCTQSPDDFAAGTRMNTLAEAHGCLVAYPAQEKSANAQKCWNWFSPADQQREMGEPALIAGITRQVMAEHGIDPRRVYVAGLSAGGAAAAILGQAYPDLYAAVGVHSGLACGAARDMPSAFAAMRGGSGAGAAPAPGKRVVPTIVFHADRDTTVHPRNGDEVIAQSAASGALRVEATRGQVPGGRAYSRSVHLDPAGQPVLEQWLVHGSGHAWSGGSAAGSYTDPAGPDASREMLRFFLEQPRSR